ncbi:MarR family winged helix-turn-helix transcriptional regulator [Actinopolymorpha alba]|uniref:MarR family winged helix-turn-helix transcriptional regulator n=1 Tax=Actinopolymorpha alba TaxID=533267 RepID=UPI0003601658|nr:MarR family winged helix-turn-helix transcriptional regulator [Actinopolymorpha alba]
MNRAQLEDLLRAINDVVLIRKDISRLATTTCHVAALGVLSVLSRSDDMRVGQLAETLQVDMSVASRQLAQLEAQGYVGRRPDPDDGRAHLVFLTEAGRHELDNVRGHVVRHFETALREWTDDDLTVLTKQLDRLRADLDQARRARHTHAGPSDRGPHRTGVNALS